MVKYRFNDSKRLTGVVIEPDKSEAEDRGFSSEEYMRALNLMQGQIELIKQDLVKLHESPKTPQNKDYYYLVCNGFRTLVETYNRALPKGSMLEVSLEIPCDEDA